MSTKINIPNVRFKGFSAPWEQRELNAISDVRDGTHDSPKYVDKGHPFVTSKNVKNGKINYDDIQYISDIDFERINKRSKVDVNDILLGMIGTIGNIAYVDTISDFAIKNVALIKDLKRVDSLFLFFELQAPVINKQFEDSMDGGTQKFISLGTVRELNISLPNRNEQIAIGIFCKSIDNLITLHQRMCDSLREIKKTLLKKMFPANGESVPEIRFKGFTDDWEQRKILDIAPLQRGFDLPVKEMHLGAFPVVMSNGIGGYHNSFKVKGPGVVTGRSGTIGKVHYVESDYWPHNTSLWVTDYHGNDPKYIYYMYQKLNLSSFGSGSGVPTLNRNDVHDTTIPIPSVDEQKRISKLNSIIDNLITLYQRRCDMLKEMKQTLLEKMFV